MISSKKKKWSQTELDPIFLLLAAGNHNKYKMFQYMVKQNGIFMVSHIIEAQMMTFLMQ